jgi:hypothetical protein
MAIANLNFLSTYNLFANCVLDVGALLTVTDVKFAIFPETELALTVLAVNEFTFAELALIEPAVNEFTFAELALIEPAVNEFTFAELAVNVLVVILFVVIVEPITKFVDTIVLFGFKVTNLIPPVVVPS